MPDPSRRNRAREGALPSRLEADLREEIRLYLEALRAAVIEKILEGKELEEMQKEIRLDEFRHLANYEEWLPANIEGMWKELMNESGMAWRP